MKTIILRLDNTSQQKIKAAPRKRRNNRGPLVYTFKSSVKVLNRKLQNTCRGHGVDLRKHCACCFSLC